MIPFMPIIYPDETWYSVIVRVHKQTGFAFWKDTIRFLYPSYQSQPSIGSIMPNESMRYLVSRLPPETISLEKLLLDHTLFRFRTLFMPPKQKQECLSRFCGGEDIQPALLALSKSYREHSPRYCPLCVQDEIKKLGEPYFHCEHQISILSLCPVHYCRLVPVKMKTTMSLSRQYLEIPFEIPEPDCNTSATEVRLTNLIHSWYSLPFKASPNKATGNLGRAIENADYLRKGSVKRLAWDGDRLYRDLTELFGFSIVDDVFGPKLTTAHMRRLRLGEISHTEEYALLSVLLQMPSDALFSAKKTPLKTEQLMRAMAAEKRPCTKSDVASRLNIRVDQVAEYARRFQIAPFWVQSGLAIADDARQTYAVTIHLSMRERNQLDAYMKEHQVSAYGHALRYFMSLHLAKWETEKEINCEQHEY